MKPGRVPQGAGPLPPSRHKWRPRLLKIVDIQGSMLTAPRTNGAPKIRSEPTFVAAASKVGLILVVQHTLPMGKTGAGSDRHRS